MRYLKKVSLLLVTSLIILLNTFSVNASTDINNVNDFFTYWVELLDESVNGDRYEEWLKKVSKHAFDTSGFLIDETGITIQKIKDAIHGSDNNMPSDMTDQEAYEWIKDNVSLSGNNIVYGDQFNNFVKNYENDFVGLYQYSQGFTIDLDGWDFSQYTGLLNTVTSNQDDYWIIYFNNTNISTSRILCIPKSDNNFYVFVNDAINTNGKVGNCYVTNKYGTYDDPRNLFANCIVYDGNGNVINPQSDNYKTKSLHYLKIKPANSNDFNFSQSGQFWLVSYEKTFSFNVYSNANILVDVTTGVAPYYYNNDVWQDFSSSSGDYVFSPTNINTVTYGDVSEYIDNSYQDNDNYPDNSQINNWIENTNTENITNNNGGGSGDNGGGSGSGDNIGNIGDIFGWLKQLGTVIASLIKGLGEFLTEVLEGVVDALTTLLEGLSSIISTVTEAIPSVFMEFIQACFEWMPSEWLALLSASLLLMVLWGIIKLLRG